MLHLDLVRVGSGNEICNPNFLFRVRVRVRVSGTFGCGDWSFALEIWFGRFSVLERMIKGSKDVWSGMAMVSLMKNRINVVCLL